MAVGRRLWAVVVIAGVCGLGIVPCGWAQQAAAAAAQTTPPSPEARQNGAITGGIARKFGSVPDDPGPLAKDVSGKMKPKAVAAAMTKVADWQLAQSQQYFAVYRPDEESGRAHLDVGRAV